jgi:hypothetical protein
MEDEASIALGPLKIWISGRQFPNHQDYWDGNWLNATALCEGNGSRVQVNGSFIHLSELKKWKEDLQEFQKTLKGSVELPTMEPTLGVKIEGRKSATGHLNCKIAITGDYIAETHQFIFDIDQSYLLGLLSQLVSVLREYPIRDENQQILKSRPKH